MANRFVTSARLISVGAVYGKWTVVRVMSPSSLCRCVCGKEGMIRNSRMIAGKVKGGCHGCANRRERHGRRVVVSDLPKGTYGRLKSKVKNAIARCTEEDHQLWDYYGGRGVRVCQEWIDDPSRFLEYISKLPGHDDPELVIDRIDNDGHYELGNIKFSTRSESQRNKGPYKRRVRV